jgi:hypothetical protein
MISSAHGLPALDEQKLMEESEGLGARLVDRSGKRAAAFGELTQ